MMTWAEFSANEPRLAEEGAALLYQHGVGLGFLATTRRDGQPRVHPMCPLLTSTGMFAFIVPSPKQRDLRRDGRFAIHSFPCAENEDAFYVTGTARLVVVPWPSDTPLPSSSWGSDRNFRRCFRPIRIGYSSSDSSRAS